MVKVTYRKSWAGNLFLWSDLTLDPSFKVIRPLKLKSAYNLLLVLDVCNVKPPFRKSWAGNLLMWSDLTLSPSFKVKRWFTGFGELSFRWIQICIGSPMHRSSSNSTFTALNLCQKTDSKVHHTKKHCSIFTSHRHCRGQHHGENRRRMEN